MVCYLWMICWSILMGALVWVVLVVFCRLLLPFAPVFRMDNIHTHIYTPSLNSFFLCMSHVCVKNVSQVPAIVKDIEDMIRSHPQVDSVTHRLVGWRQARLGTGGWLGLGVNLRCCISCHQFIVFFSLYHHHHHHHHHHHRFVYIIILMLLFL